MVIGLTGTSKVILAREVHGDGPVVASLRRVVVVAMVVVADVEYERYGQLSIW